MIHARTDYDRIQDPENKIGKDEPVFLLRGTDKFAPATIRFWAELVGASGDEELSEYIKLWADKTELWQLTNKSKTPDTPEEFFRKNTDTELK